MKPSVLSVLSVLCLAPLGCAYIAPSRAHTEIITTTNGITTREVRDSKTGRILALGDARQVIDKQRVSNGKTHSLGNSGVEQETTTTNVPAILNSAGGLIGEAAKAFLKK